jgi:succinate dehydrogenase / fumarate reductase flavoprotein subunit
VHADLQETMQNLVGIFRTEVDLQQALTKLEQLKQRSQRLRVSGSRLFNPGWHLSRDLKFMLTVSEAVTRSAMARRESRGAHSRIDYPNLDAAWGKQNNVITKRGNQMELRQASIAPMPEELQALLAEEKGAGA